MTKKVENIIILLLAVLLIGVVAARFFESNRIRDFVGEMLLLRKELEITKQIEGNNILSLFTHAIDKIRIESILSAQPNKAKFVVILNDSSCYPCFANYIGTYILDLRENGFEIDPTQWFGVFSGNAINDVNMMFRSTFGPNAKILHITTLPSSLDPHDDAYILFLTENNFILSVSKIYKADTELRGYFLDRVVNYLRSKSKSTN